MVIMSKKEVPLPKRPQPPKVEDIVEDIDDTDSNDVVFQRNNDVAAGGDSTPGLMYESFSYDSSPGSEQGERKHTNVLAESEAADDLVEGMYKQAVQFINISETLRCAPDKLKLQCDHLLTSSQELKLTIEQMKDQASSVISTGKS